MRRLGQAYRQLKSDLVNVERALRLALSLPRFFREPLTLRWAEEKTKRLLETRAERFLGLVRYEVYERPKSPYLPLFRHAGCEFSDLENAVSRHGLEPTLVKLAADGVYLTSDEFKGKTEIVRGGTSYRVSPQDFERRDSFAGYTTESSGTRNPPVTSFSSLDWRLVQLYGRAFFFQAHALFSCVHAIYEPVLAGRINHILNMRKLGIPLDRWFALDVASHGALEDSFHYLNARIVAWAGSGSDCKIARPEYLPPGDLDPIIEWLEENRLQGKRCCITTVVSNATRIARKALQAGTSLDHVTFAASGEPLTEAKKRVIEGAGARIALLFGLGGGMAALFGCGNPRYIDELHVPDSVLIFAENPRVVDAAGARIHPIMLTSMHGAAPRFLFNVENGDYATTLTRDCGCPLEKVGFKQHIHTVRSFEKMTGEGMNYAGSDLFELLENIIPSEFGGGPGDYQLVEEEDDLGQTRLTLVVHPQVGGLDDEKLLSRLQAGLSQGSRNHRFISKVWQDAGSFRIRREVPHASSRGKVLPLYVRH